MVPPRLFGLPEIYNRTSEEDDVAKKKLRAVLIGAGGNMRGAHVPRILSDGAVQIVGVADPVAEQAARLVDRVGYEIDYFEDWTKMLRGVDHDAVLISTPHSDHYQQVRTGLRKAHVLVEKPLVIKPTHAKALLKLSKDTHRILVVAYQRHWMREYQYARELVQKGAVGNIRGVIAYVTQDWTNVGGWRLDPSVAGGGMFMDTGSHLVASTLWVTGLAPRKVTATADNAGKKVDVNAAVNVEFDNGSIGTLTTIGNARRHDERLAISGDRGSLVLHLHQWRVKSFLLNDEPVTIPKRVTASTPDAALFNGIRRGYGSVESPNFAVAVSQLTDAAYRSVAQRKSIRVGR